jgi:hypothetical protein
MSEHAFSDERFLATAIYMTRRMMEMSAPDVCGDKLAVMMFLADMDAFQKLGEPITGATWVRGVDVPYCREMGEGYLQGVVLSQAHYTGKR